MTMGRNTSMSRAAMRTAVIAVTASLLAAACAKSPDTPGELTGPDSSTGSSEAVIDLGDDEIMFTAALSAFDECDSLLDHLRSEYAERVGPWGFEASGRHGPGIPELAGADVMEASGVVTDDSDQSSTEAVRAGLVEGVDYSGTNVQEAGVDEADLVKTDGRRIFAVSDGRLSVIDAAARRVVGSVGIASGFSAEMFLDGDDLLVILSGYSSLYETAADDGDGDGNGSAEHDQPVTVVQRVRVDGDTPSVVETLRMEGAYVSARSVGGVARVVTRHGPPRSFPFVFPQGGIGSEQAAEKANRAAVLASTLEDWLPSYAVADVFGPAEGGRQPACGNVYVPSEFAGFGVTTVMSLPVGGPLASDSAVSVTAPGDIVYATPRSLYVATSAWIAPEILEDDAARQQIAEDWQAAIHRFDLTDPDRAAYAASGLVPGRIHNQFSLSEHDGHLRVVTTTGDLWWDQDGEAPSSSQVRVLRQTGDRLMEVGSVGDIGRGEQVQSVRFAGDVGYVVTFRQVDPFYTLDLSDPENPAVVGELKIPGFSSYLHPISDDLVLGVGFDADETAGVVTGSKVSLFDVSDLANPQELDVWTAPDAHNDAGWDHRAFLWWEPARMAVFGISSWTDQTAEAVALRIEDGSLTEIGRVDHAEGCQILNMGMAEELKHDDRLYELWETLTDLNVIACEPDESPSVVDFDCQPVGWTPLDWVFEEAGIYDLIPGDETLFSCEPDPDLDYLSPVPRPHLDVIVRSMVIGDELWTLSYSSGNTRESPAGKLATSDLTTLKRITLIGLS